MVVTRGSRNKGMGGELVIIEMGKGGPEAGGGCLNGENAGAVFSREEETVVSFVGKKSGKKKKWLGGVAVYWSVWESR